MTALDSVMPISVESLKKTIIVLFRNHIGRHGGEIKVCVERELKSPPIWTITVENIITGHVRSFVDVVYKDSGDCLGTLAGRAVEHFLALSWESAKHLEDDVAKRANELRATHPKSVKALI